MLAAPSEVAEILDISPTFPFQDQIHANVHNTTIRNKNVINIYICILYIYIANNIVSYHESTRKGGRVHYLQIDVSNHCLPGNKSIIAGNGVVGPRSQP